MKFATQTLTLCLVYSVSALRLQGTASNPWEIAKRAMQNASSTRQAKFKADGKTWELAYTKSVLQGICDAFPFNPLMGTEGMAFSLGVSYPDVLGKSQSIGVSCGLAFIGLNKPVQVSSEKNIFAMGSTTKMFTAAAILKLVEQGKLGLDDKMVDRMGRAWSTLVQKLGSTDAAGLPTHTSLSEWLGHNITQVTIRQMIGMSSGLPDFDNDASRKYQLLNPNVNLGPIEEIDFIKDTKIGQKEKFDCKPGTCTCYSSTNYEFAGLVLMQAAGIFDDFKKYNQWSGVPDSIKNDMPNTVWPNEPLCSGIPNMLNGWTTTLTPSPPIMAVYDVSCTNGWTCGNIDSTAQDAANFVRRYLTTNEYIGAALRAEALTLTKFSMTCSWEPGQLPYGFGLMDLSKVVGYPTYAKKFVGHAGDTYGFNANTGADLTNGFAVSVTGNTENGIPVDMLTLQTYWTAMLSIGAVEEGEYWQNMARPPQGVSKGYRR